MCHVQISRALIARMASSRSCWRPQKATRRWWMSKIGMKTIGRPGGRTMRADGSRPGRRYANSRARIDRLRTLRRLASSNLRQQVPLENLLQDFIVNLGVGVNWGTTGGNWQLFLGNPGDYAWGREGLDAIVTQLLNQMDSTGPPPVSKAVIDALPIVEITAEQFVAKLQCSVCWEDFLTASDDCPANTCTTSPASGRG
nr:unnamed protein product [Callosobruchus chinensis]